MKNFNLICLFLFIQLTSFAHNGTVKGIVYDSVAAIPLSGVNVILVKENKSAITDVLGNFTFKNMSPGRYEVKISYIGYQPKVFAVEVEENKTIELMARLTVTPALLSEVVVTGDKASSLSSISSLDIKLRPLNSSQDILRIVPGLFIAQHAGGGKAEQIFLRGFDIDHGTDINLSVDGLPVNMVSHAHGQGFADLHFLIPETVDKVDFVKGPYHANYGDFSTAGGVAFKTKNYLSSNLFKLEAGRFDNFRAVTMLNLLDGSSEKTKKNESAYIAAEYFYRNNFFTNPENFDRINVMAKYHGVISENTVLTAIASTMSSKWNASGQIPERAVNSGLISRFGFLDNSEGGNTNRSNASVSVSKLFSNGAVFKNQLYFVNYGFQLFSNFTFFLKDSINGDQIRQKENRNIFGYNGSYVLESRIGNKRLTSTLGAGLRKDQVSGIELSHTKKRKFLEYIKYGDVDEISASAYVDESLELSPKLTLNAALRLDHFMFRYTDALVDTFLLQKKSKAVASPKLHLYYTANPTTQLYLKSGISFHSNDARVVVAEQNENTLPRAFGSEIGATFKINENLLVNTSLWTLFLEQEFVYVGDEGVVEPSGRTMRRGIDLSVRYQLTKWLYGDVDLNYAHPRSMDEEAGNDYIPLAPIFTSIGGLTAKLKNGINGSVRYRYMGNRPANESYTTTAKGYFLADAVLNYTTNRFQIGLIAENILNQSWKEAQFDTESRLRNESAPVSEIHFTAGTPFFIKASVSFFF